MYVCMNIRMWVLTTGRAMVGGTPGCAMVGGIRQGVQGVEVHQGV